MAQYLDSTIVFIFSILTLNYNFKLAGTTSQNLFGTDLLSIIRNERSSENVVYSPVSIQTSLVIALLGAEGKMAAELRQALKLDEEDKLLIAQRYGEYLQTILTKSKENAPQLIMSNRMFVNKLKVLSHYKDLVLEHFQLQTERLDFSKSKEEVQEINEWIEKHYVNKIKKCLPPDAVNEETSAILVNTIFFKGKWLNPFNSINTSKMPFYKNENENITVDMMYTYNKFNYAELPEFDAKAIELPYENSEISMMIILPNKMGDLKNLEKKLVGKDLNDISSKMTEQNVKLSLPKFSIEYDIDLKDHLKKAKNHNLKDFINKKYNLNISMIILTDGRFFH